MSSRVGFVGGHSICLGGGLACLGLAGLGVGIVPDRLVVDLAGDGQAEVLSWPAVSGSWLCP